MSRNYTREQQRRYREVRQRKALLVAERLMGRNKPIWNGSDPVGPDHDDFIDALKFRFAQDLWTNKPRMSAVISGMEGI